MISHLILLCFFFSFFLPLFLFFLWRECEDFHLCEENGLSLAQVTQRSGGKTLLSGFKELFDKLVWLLMPLFSDHGWGQGWKEYFCPAWPSTVSNMNFEITQHPVPAASCCEVLPNAECWMYFSNLLTTILVFKYWHNLIPFVIQYSNDVLQTTALPAGQRRWGRIHSAGWLFSCRRDGSGGLTGVYQYLTVGTSLSRGRPQRWSEGWAVSSRDWFGVLAWRKLWRDLTASSIPKGGLQKRWRGTSSRACRNRKKGNGLKLNESRFRY